ncbi:D-glycero-alpha-D-manno-heptose-1,7-bisphosphate 7-phosphatase [Chitinophaga nivalis]|uniref:D,D-heptose 1,7-bisphosphate phosphatase n=1 Tax=Chitinophaga nivalis TaxID=2991709 RepID=A0ABT3IIB7_9BACT|nr:HAD-IIIA family hydrolase [Chitinophaga nivalis]MCW3466805.1 HAD-IIIA family hydrolase [Chitinophaga nivalis]MCW3483504.1 HAD-IIIA family hydrolase [Chitinophaga nivalis]
MTLFLDRDGVINDEIRDSYVLHPDMFRFSDGVLTAMPLLAQHFERIVIVTNQRCIGRGLLTVAGLEEIHAQMLATIRQHGGRIDNIYFCPDVNNDSPCRKPQSGMALQARQDFPEIDFEQSVMVGNTLSDMQFGKTLGMHTVFIPSTWPEVPFPHPLIDKRVENLLQFAQEIQ